MEQVERVGYMSLAELQRHIAELTHALERLRADEVQALHAAARARSR